MSQELMFFCVQSGKKNHSTPGFPASVIPFYAKNALCASVRAVNWWMVGLWGGYTSCFSFPCFISSFPRWMFVVGGKFSPSFHPPPFLTAIPEELVHNCSVIASLIISPVSHWIRRACSSSHNPHLPHACLISHGYQNRYPDLTLVCGSRIRS